MKIAINSRTSGKFRHEQIGGRDHIVTTMMPIRGDTTMNGILYPDAEVKASFMQLNMMPAPNGHPMINGEHVPAFHPVANNAFNVGGFIRNPRKKGKRVFVDFCLDVEVANRCDDGKKLIKNIEESKKVGVSTGLTINQVVNKSGSDDFGKEYQRTGHGFNFDHVAILQKEVAAGDHAGTELVLNEEGDELIVNLEVNELSTDEMYSAIREEVRQVAPVNTWVWVQEVFPDSRTFIYQIEPKEGNPSDAKLFSRSFSLDENDEISLSDDAVEVVRRVEFEPKTTATNAEGEDMDQKLLVLAIIGNSANNFTVDDQAKLEAMSETGIVAALSVNEEQAEQIMTNAGSFDRVGYDEFQANKEAWEDYKAKETERLDGVRAEIVANSEYTLEMLEGKPEAELSTLAKMADPKKAAIHANSGASTEATPGGGSDAADGVDFND